MNRPSRGTTAKAPFRSDLGTLRRSSIADELAYAGDYAVIATMRGRDGTSPKKNFAESLSRALSQRIADVLRPQFPAILPDVDGKGQESPARTGKGLKKLDVNYSTIELGLGLGISIKTINFRDESSKRYTKNFTRADNEFRAEAADYHQRQPYAVLCAVFFLPLDSCDDGERDPSSFGHAVRTFRFRTGRRDPKDDPTLFERFIIGLYDTKPESFGEVRFFDVEQTPPKNGQPTDLFDLDTCLGSIIETYDRRNSTTFVWRDAPSETTFTGPVDDEPLDESRSLGTAQDFGANLIWRIP